MVNTDKLVSIIIPAYNVEDYIQRCLDSLVSQSYNNIEIIVIDDGSTDSTGVICEKYAGVDKRIKYHKKTNEGQGIARNLAMELALGEYVTYVDSDDWCESTYVEKMLNSMLQYDTDICVCGKYGVKLDENGNIISKKKIEQWMQPDERIEVASNKNLIYQIKFSLWSKMFKRSLFIDNNIKQPNHKFENNTVIPMLVSKAKYISMVDEELYYYWMNRGNSTINTASSYADMIKCLRGVKNYLETEGYMSSYADAFYGFCRWNVNHTLERISRIKAEKETCENIGKELKDFIKDTFANKVYWLDKKVTVWGSYNLKRTVKNLIPGMDIKDTYSFQSIVSAMSDKVNIERNIHANEYREKMISKDMGKTFVSDEYAFDDVDIFFIDLLEERFMPANIEGKYVTNSDIFGQVVKKNMKSMIRDDRYWGIWKEACDRFVEVLRSRMAPDKVVLVKYYLSDEYGHGKIRYSYENVEYIREINKWLEKAYEYFQNKCVGCRVIEPSRDMYYYTDEEFEYGCLPHHLNYMIYERTANDIIEKMEMSKNVF